ncbi:hypothetical protein [Agarilytica rhodophyticola]|uniref:hypothetical protein n=1 Tax=Agarilytica rhodophyticola TaxID=1737490 RepID=UPI000B342279|nr:hypothetical protein [Agarilytica rhodophyticola]
MSNQSIKTIDTEVKQQTSQQPIDVPLKNITTMKVVDTENSTTQNGQAIQANTNIFGKPNMRLEGALLDNGEKILSIPFAKDNFTLDQLFTDFSIPNIDLFVFSDVDIHIETNPQAEKPTTINFSGKLDINQAPLTSIAPLLNINEAPLMTATIESGDTDLSDKVNPQAVTLSTETTLEVAVIPNVFLTKGAFEIQVEKADKDQWQILPSAKGILEINQLGESAGELEANIEYKDKQLELSASSVEINNAFDIQGLTLSDLAVDATIGTSKVLNISALLATDQQNYKLSGTIADDRAGVYASISSFSMDDIDAIFSALTKENISLPNFAFELKNVVLGFATADGVYGTEHLSEGAIIQAEIAIFDYNCTAKTHISKNGLEFIGSLGSLSVGPVDIHQAKLELNLYSQTSGRDSSFAIVGEAEIEGIELECKLVFQENNGKWEQILYAGLNADAFSMSTVFPPAKNSFIDTFSFSKIAFIYSSFEGNSQDSDFSFNVKQGLQLLGTMNQIPALSDLTGKDDLALELGAYFGTEKEITISLPDTRLDLGSSVTTSPFSIGIAFAPQPSLDLVFVLDVDVPKQNDPLHFDLSLSVGAIQASGAGTMKNYWENPFGLNGLKVGPNLALEVGIIYQQFLATGTPSSFGFVGGLVLGNVVAQMAMKISAIPSEQILMGKLEQLSPENLIAFVNQAAKANIPTDALPDIIDIRDLELYIAPAGGSIGTVTFEQGFSFDADLVLFGKEISLHARLGDDGISADGSIDRIAIGPLTIQGKDGDDAEFDFDLTTSKQGFLIDGELDFLGTGVGIYVDISNQGIEFNFEQSFLGLLTYSVEGKSSGNLDKPETLDFALAAEFDNDLTAYLKNDLSKKINQAADAVNESIEHAQEKVDEAEKQYKKEFDKANKKLQEAKKKADALSEQLNAELASEKRKYKQDIKAAKAEIERAEKTYNNALKDAQDTVNQAQAKYNKAMKDAQAAVDKAQRTYNNGVKAAQDKVNTAERDYNNSIKSAKRSFDSAIRKVNSLNSSINSAKKKLKKEKKKTFPNPLKLTKYAAEIAGLETAKATANTALKAAKATMSGTTKGAQYVAFETAKGTLKAAKEGANYVAFNNAKKALEATRKGVQYTAFETAKGALTAVRKGAEFTAWKAAEEGLNAAEIAGQAAISAAQDAVNNIGKTGIYIAFKTAQAALEAVKHGTSAVAFESAKAALEGAKQSAGATLDLAEYVAKHSGDIIDLRYVRLSGHLKGILKGDFFTAKIDLSVFGKEYKTTIDFDVQDVDGFIEALFKDTLKFFNKTFA